MVGFCPQAYFSSHNVFLHPANGFLDLYSSLHKFRAGSHGLSVYFWAMLGSQGNKRDTHNLVPLPDSFLVQGCLAGTKWLLEILFSFPLPRATWALLVDRITPQKPGHVLLKLLFCVFLPNDSPAIQGNREKSSIFYGFHQGIPN